MQPKKQEEGVNDSKERHSECEDDKDILPC